MTAADHTPSPATDGLREARVGDEITVTGTVRTVEDLFPPGHVRVTLDIDTTAPPSETATEYEPIAAMECMACGSKEHPMENCPDAPNAPPVSSDEDRADEGDDGPECETCGKTTCPDADLAGFSEPVNCAYKPIFDALRDAKDCDYGCGRDLTNQEVRLYVVPAVENILSARLGDQAAHLHARWHRALDDPDREPDGPIREHIRQHDALVTLTALIGAADALPGVDRLPDEPTVRIAAKRWLRERAAKFAREANRPATTTIEEADRG